MLIYSQFKTMVMIEEESVKEDIALQTEYQLAPLTDVSDAES